MYNIMYNAYTRISQSREPNQCFEWAPVNTHLHKDG